MPSMPQGVESRPNPFFLNQHVVRIVSRDSENRNLLRRKRLDEGQQHSSQRKGKRPLKFQTNPVQLRPNVMRKISCRTDNRQFVRTARNRTEFTFRGPIGHRFVRSKAHDNVRSREPPKFKLRCHARSAGVLVGCREGVSPSHPEEQPVLNLSHNHPSTAFRTAALASNRVESKVGNGEASGVTNNGISVHPSTTASHPSSFSARITST